MDCTFYNYEFRSEEYNNRWRCILSNKFNSMELYYRKQFSMQRLLSHYKKAFKIAPITLKTSHKDKHYKHKLLAIYLLTKYSKEEFELIAKEFHTSLQTIHLIAANNTYKTTFEDDIKLFFKQFEDDYLVDRKSSLAFKESVELASSRQPNVKKDII